MSDADLLNIFWGEVNNYLQTLNNALLQIETASAQDNTSVLREMNRVAHSMKGAAHAVGINVIETISHYMEDLFDAAVNGRFTLTPDTCDLLYDGLDLIQNVVNGNENSTDVLATVLARLEQTVVALPKDGRKAELRTEKKRTTHTKVTPVIKPKTGEMTELGTLQLRPAEDQIRVPVSKLDRLMAEVSELLIVRMHGEERQRDLYQLHKYTQRWGREWRSVRTAYIRLARRLQNDQGDIPDEMVALFKFLETNQRYLAETNHLLGQLNQSLAQYNTQLGMLAEQLQDDIGGMRLVPFESVVSAFQRMVRDMARDTSKDIHLDIKGTGVEMDRAALDALKEPIMHLLRNAADHGIETVAERAAVGKSPTARIELAVEQRGKEIIVSITDDGRGIDPYRIGRAAHHAGLLTPQEAANLSAEEAYNLMFYPGFSTSDEVTSLSGRGMGMDIVRTRVEQLRGRVSVQSAIGKGTTFSLRIPVSLTRMSCILLKVGEQEFAVPSVAVARMMKFSRDQVFTAEGREMVMIEDQPVPLQSLADILEVSASASILPEATLMVLSVGERAVALEVDALYSEQELVLKTLGPEIQNAPFVSGAALLGTGDVIIVLDANALIRASHTGQRPHATVRRIPEQVELTAPQPLRILIADDSITTRTLEKHILENAGFEVHVAIDGVEAWTKLTEMYFDVLISDVEMPNMNGLELTRRVKDNEQTRRLPVILLTSLAKPEQREAGLKAGADAYLVKSKFDQSELLGIIQALV